ncbi:LOW QUALITY PROTEIN: glutaredoxin [Elaeis guineensis]|uniref:LOW QUALITY PROTEIN: glutaredoxin n=1 Tax=Elaeis guineensis var. tenera TaxID=51953 RepID=UPI003C6D5B77
MALAKAKDIVSSAPVVVFSKTYCGYCKRVRQLLAQLGASYEVIELDVESDGSEMHPALVEWTVPNVFIGGNHVGGCDVVLERHDEGKLVPQLMGAGVLPSPAE